MKTQLNKPIKQNSLLSPVKLYHPKDTGKLIFVAKCPIFFYVKSIPEEGTRLFHHPLAYPSQEEYSTMNSNIVYIIPLHTNNRTPCLTRRKNDYKRQD